MVLVVGHVEVLVERHIEPLVARAVEHVARRGSEEARSRLLPGSRIHPLSVGSGRAVGENERLARNVIRPRRLGAANNGIGAGIVVVVSLVVGYAGREGGDGAEFSASDHRIQSFRRRTEEEAGPDEQVVNH